ncbi:MAG: uracil-DNA glycosylase [Pseudomonadota bacterium]
MDERLKAWQPEVWPVAQGWRPAIESFFESTDGIRLSAFMQARLAAGAVIYPPEPFRALALTPLSKVRAVIVGQDPYHGRGQAEGLAFSVRRGVRPPPSLQNIFKEMRRDGFALTEPADGSLVPWATRGVLLLNTSLTVEDGEAGSHAKKGWETLTDLLLEQVAATASPCVYMLWGAHAQAKAGLIENAAERTARDHLILKANHPSPLSARRPPVPFLGCGHFSQARQWLSERGYPDIF